MTPNHKMPKFRAGDVHHHEFAQELPAMAGRAAEESSARLSAALPIEHGESVDLDRRDTKVRYLVPFRERTN
jgi:hypothetical protein